MLAMTAGRWDTFEKPGLTSRSDCLRANWPKPLYCAAMTFRIIPATPQHAETIARFNQLMAMETENKELPWDTVFSGVQEMFTDTSLGFYLVAIDSQDHIVGCLAITYEWSDWRDGLFWWIQSVYVERPQRSQGVFSAMYAAVKEAAAQQDKVCGIRLYVEKENERAQRTYLKLGMTETAYRIMEEEF
jgi:ribosomal protein S18 acetylase RimI-like enzyme